jgi:YD repeat-containing protein
VEYNILGQVKRSSVPTEINSSWAPSGDDAIYPNFLWMEHEYDWKGRPTKETNTDGTFKSFSYNGCGCAGGQVTEIKGEQLTEGRRTQKIYADILGREFKSEVLNWDGSVYSTTKSVFNAADQAIEVKQFAGSETSSDFQTVTKTFDGFGRIKTSHSPEQIGSTVYSYNSNGQLQQIEDARGAKRQNSYNSLGQLEQVNYVSPTGSTTVPNAPTVTFTYNNLGMLTLMTDGIGNTAFEYNNLGKLKSETRQFNSSLPNAPLANNKFKLQYSYDSLSSQLTSLTDPYGQQINYAFDKVGRLNNITGSTAFGGVTNYLTNPQYRAFGELKHLEFGDNNTQMNMSYNNNLQASMFELLKPGRPNNLLMRDTYDYYDDGALKFIHSETPNELSGYFDRKYEYDHVSRVTSEKSGAEARGETNITNTPYKEEFFYNAFGNLLARKANNWSQEFDYNFNRFNNQPMSTFSNNRKQNTLYDNDGNVLTDGTEVYTFDSAGQLSKIIGGDGLNIETVIGTDGNGHQLKRSARRKNPNNTWGSWTSSYTIRSSVLDGQIISEVDNLGRKKTTLVYAGSEVLAKQKWNQSTNTKSVVWKHDDPSGKTEKYSAINQQATYIEERNEEKDVNGLAMAKADESPGVYMPEFIGATRPTELVGDAKCDMDGISVSCAMLDGYSAYLGLVAQGFANLKEQKEAKKRTAQPSGTDSPIPSILPSSGGKNNPMTFASHSKSASFNTQSKGCPDGQVSVKDPVTGVERCVDKPTGGVTIKDDLTPIKIINRRENQNEEIDFQRHRLRIRLSKALSGLSSTCLTALNAIGISNPNDILDTFDKIKFVANKNEKASAATTFYDEKPQRIASKSGVGEFQAARYTIGFIIHELSHAKSKLNDKGLYNLLLSSGVNGLSVNLVETGFNRKTKMKFATKKNYSDALSGFYNYNCK